MNEDFEVELLVEEARRGQGEAFDRLVCLHQAKVRIYLSRFIRSDETVDDLAQDTFLKAYRRLLSYRGDGQFSTWLLSIAKHEALMHLREQGRRKSTARVPLESVLESMRAARVESGKDSDLTEENRLGALKACLGGLPAHSARVLQRFYFQKESGAAIARELQKQEGAFWVMLLRIRQSLKQCMERRLATTEGSL